MSNPERSLLAPPEWQSGSGKHGGDEQVRSGILKAAYIGKGQNHRRCCGTAFRVLPSTVAMSLGLIIGSAAHSQGVVVPKSGPPSGEKLFGQQCGACHSTIAGEVRVGPSLAGVVGRTAGKSPGFNYSSALRSSRIKWTDQTLNLWLADSNAQVPGSVMNYRQPDAAKRLAIIGYLKGLNGK
ncbi:MULTISPECIES: cytochrome c family protein [unclassified Sphingobium]|uniref:c-type cytochrome n=1 Tax=unclassified Sphingobium TaxID=2611147 RepID=UPI0035A5C142